jgi:hypothetical protein
VVSFAAELYFEVEGGGTVKVDVVVLRRREVRRVSPMTGQPSTRRASSALPRQDVVQGMAVLVAG